ncbi:hypothetical protein HDU76_004308 [Blyttiomyces sp. JEL0837]|nr:hypothetical protein HDU76_004308 [Blyttiomyces sp. JEL0837]
MADDSEIGGEQISYFQDLWAYKLTEEEADVRKFIPSPADKALYETAARKSANGPVNDDSTPSHEGEASPLPQIKALYIGKWKVQAWYAAPYPEEYNQQPYLYICEFCLKYMKSSFGMQRHKSKCLLKSPPGNEIYRDGRISIFEVDGRKNKNLCLLAKIFLDHKTLYYDVEPFLFYVMTESDNEGFHFVGYFSKEKRSSSNYNLSCIVTLPVYQRKGYGFLLIDFSEYRAFKTCLWIKSVNHGSQGYLLSKKEGKPGSPEKPLSDLGLMSYRSYWRYTILKELRALEGDEVTLDELRSRTSMTYDDIVATLANLEMLVKDSDGRYVIRINVDIVEEYLKRIEAKGYPSARPGSLRWSPFLSKRDSSAHQHHSHHALGNAT